MNDSQLNDPDAESRPQEYVPISTPSDPPIETIEDWNYLRGKVRTWGNQWKSPSRANYPGQ